MASEKITYSGAILPTRPVSSPDDTYAEFLRVYGAVNALADRCTAILSGWFPCVAGVKAGDLIYPRSSDGRWTRANGDSLPAFGFCTGIAGDTCQVIVGGITQVNGLTPGLAYYCNSSGRLTASPGTQQVGVALGYSWLRLTI